MMCGAVQAGHVPAASLADSLVGYGPMTSITHRVSGYSSHSEPVSSTTQ